MSISNSFLFELSKEKMCKLLIMKKKKKVHIHVGVYYFANSYNDTVNLHVKPSSMRYTRQFSKLVFLAVC